MSEELSLAKLNEATKLLAECHTIEEALKIHDMAEAARHYAKMQDMSLDAINAGTELKLRALRKLGEILKETEKNKGTKGQLKGKKKASGGVMVDTARKNQPPTLKDIGVSKKQSSVAQTIASIATTIFEDHIKATKEAGEELTTAGTVRAAQAEKRKQVHQDVEEQPLPSSKFRVIYCDPPWKYGNKGLDEYGHAERHYPTMSIVELCELPIKDLSEQNAALFMWVTSPILAECFEVISAWGFTYKASFIWDKVKHNYGHYNSVRHELLLVCTKGSCLPDVKELHDSVVSIERGEHSEKPEYFRKMIDGLYTHGNRIELFATKQLPEGWVAWGNQLIME